ncbi:MAG TPA: hypothetical protein VJ805_13735, partial [Nitrospiraceae bacterium]|nr:hypothetical protein [Nitrospiraceae bacterium]
CAGRGDEPQPDQDDENQAAARKVLSHHRCGRMSMLNAATAQISMRSAKLRERNTHPLSSCMFNSPSDIVDIVLK